MNRRDIKRLEGILKLKKTLELNFEGDVSIEDAVNIKAYLDYKREEDKWKKRAKKFNKHKSCYVG